MPKSITAMSWLFLIGIFVFPIFGTLGLGLAGLAVLGGLASQKVLGIRSVWYREGIIYFTAVLMLVSIFIATTFSNGGESADFSGLSRLLPLVIFATVSLKTIFNPNIINKKSLSRASTVCLVVNFCAWQLFDLGAHSLFGATFHVEERFAFLSGNPLPYAMALATVIPLIFLRFNEDSRFEKAVKITAALLGLTVLTIGTGGRSGMIIAFFILIALSWMLSKSWKQFAMLGTLAVFLSAGVVYSLYEYATPRPSSLTKFEDTFRKTFDSSISFQERSYRHDNWYAASQAIAQKPLTGYGFHQRSEAARSYFVTQNKWTHLHNDVLTSWVAGGILAALLAAGLIFANLFAAFGPLRHDKPLAFVAFCGFGNVFTNAMVNVALFQDITSASVALCFVLPVMLARMEPNH